MKNPPILPKLLFVIGISLISGCGGIYDNYDVNNPDPIDRSSGLNRQDFSKELLPKPNSEFKNEVVMKEPPLPKITDTLAAPKPPKIGSDKTITISVTDEIELKDVFMEIARLAKVDIQVDSAIKGGVNLRATDRPVGEVIERICDMAGLRYSIKNGTVIVMNDSPYTENYQASYLNLIRKNTNQIGTSTKISTGDDKSTGSAGSESSITASSGGGGDIWISIESEVKAIASSGGGEDSVTLNREAGLISVKTTAKNHKKIKQYLDQVQAYYSAQVLIEAKVVEVTLNDQFSTGIDWTFFRSSGQGITTAFPDIIKPAVDKNFIAINFGNGDLDAVVNLAQNFGTIRTLSSPRLLAMNSQQSILSFTRNETYFKLTCEVTDAVVQDGNIVTPAKVEVTSQPQNLPVGVVLNIQPSIDKKEDEISMNVRPTLTRLTGVKYKDPGIVICASNAKDLLSPADLADLLDNSKIPQIDVREMDSVLRLKSGEIMAIGGMIDQADENTDAGVPYLSDLPLLGNAFKNVVKSTKSVQTVIFLKATIVPGYGVDAEDQKFYNKFHTDPRALNFK